jgi:hypothetical protein
MILWKFKEFPETRGENYPCESFRWVIQTDSWSGMKACGDRFAGVSIEISTQVKFRDRKEWTQGCQYYCVSVTNAWKLGSEHIYYDGPHCSFSMGFLHFSWTGWNGWCKKCESDMNDYGPDDSKG